MSLSYFSVRSTLAHRLRCSCSTLTVSRGPSSSSAATLSDPRTQAAASTRCPAPTEEMETSSPAEFVNAETLNMSIGRRVRTVVQVQRDEGGIVIGQSTDGQLLTIKGVDVPISVSHFMEVFGIAEANLTIRAEICTDFGPNFDPKAYDGLCKLACGKFRHMFM